MFMSKKPTSTTAKKTSIKKESSEKVKCDNCGKEFAKNELKKCDKCGKMICNDCGNVCFECEGYFCENCGHVNAEQEQFFCADCIRTCDICQNECSKTHTCVICKRELCEGCNSESLSEDALINMVDSTICNQCSEYFIAQKNKFIDLGLENYFIYSVQKLIDLINIINDGNNILEINDLDDFEDKLTSLLNALKV